MYTFEYCFYPKTFQQPEIDDYDESMQWFLAALEKNGQILSHYYNTVKLDNHYACRVTAPEIDSLHERYWNTFCRKFYHEVAEKSVKMPVLQYIGENYDVPDCCTCSDPSHYILLSEYAQYTIPILCGDCLQTVPLYKFPKTYDKEEYYDVLSWQKLYESCDRQFTEGIGERFGYKMMHDPNSLLSREGMRICKFLEKETGKPFYYFLFQYYRKNKDTCPICNGQWVNQQTGKVHYDMVCHHCRIVSNDPW